MPVTRAPLQLVQPQRKQQFAPRDTPWEYFKRQAPITVLGSLLQPGMEWAGEKLTRPSKTAAEIEVATERSALDIEKDKQKQLTQEAVERRREGRFGLRTDLANFSSRQLARTQMLQGVFRLQGDLAATVLQKGESVGWSLAEKADAVLKKNTAFLKAAYNSYKNDPNGRFQNELKSWAKRAAESQTAAGGQPQALTFDEFAEPYRKGLTAGVEGVKKTVTSTSWQKSYQDDPARALDIVHEMLNEAVLAGRFDAESERQMTFEMMVLNAREAGMQINPKTLKDQLEIRQVRGLVQLQTAFEKNFYRTLHGNKWQDEYAKKETKLADGAIMPGLRSKRIQPILKRFGHLFAPHQRKALGLKEEDEADINKYATILKGENKGLMLQGDNVESALHRFLGTGVIPEVPKFESEERPIRGALSKRKMITGQPDIPDPAPTPPGLFTYDQMNPEQRAQYVSSYSSGTPAEKNERIRKGTAPFQLWPEDKAAAATRPPRNVYLPENLETEE